MSNYSLHNLSNYNNDYKVSTNKILTKYVGLMREYFIQVTDCLHIKDVVYFKYIICKGIQTITHVFKMILLYTKNLELAYYYGQKAFYYYTEFIGQIVQIEDDNIGFLHLNCKDASLFVYKKTIFEINNDFKKNFGSIAGSCNITDNIGIIINIYNSLLYIIIKTFDFDNTKNLLFSEIDKKLIKLITNLLNLSLNIDEDIYYEKLKIINFFYINLQVENIDKINYLEEFIYKVGNNNITEKQLFNKLMNKDNNNILLNQNANKYIDWIFN